MYIYYLSKTTNFYEFNLFMQILQITWVNKVLRPAWHKILEEKLQILTEFNIYINITIILVI